MAIKLKIVKNPNAIKLANVNFAYVASPKNQPTIVSSIGAASSFAPYSNTAQMLANDATTYANAVNFASQAAAAAYANAIAYTSNQVSNVSVASLSDVVLSTVPPANNSTLVYNSANNKYVVRQIDVDGGKF